MARFGERQNTPRRSAPGTSRIHVTVRMNEEQHRKADAVAEALGISLNAYLIELSERVELDANGMPTWESKYAPKPKDDPQEALELSA